MTDRPIAAVLGAIAAVVFVAVFAAAAVMRPNQSAGAENASSRTAPASATEEVRAATLASPSLSGVAALPALHLPKERKPARRKPAKKAPEPEVSAPVSPPPPAATATPPAATPTAAPPPRVVTPPRPDGGSNVGETFDSEG